MAKSKTSRPAATNVGARTDVRLTAVIRAIQEYPKETCGAPRVHAELVFGQGMHVARKVDELAAMR